MKKYIYLTIITSCMVYAILTISCQKLEPVVVTKFVPLSIDQITFVGINSATIKGEFMDLSPGISSYGCCWSIAPGPTTNDLKISFSDQPKKQTEFLVYLNLLEPNKKYYVRFFAITGSSPVYSNEISFITVSNTLTDIEGNPYDAVQIGKQIWMKQNLKTTKYRNGESIPTTNPASLDISLESTPRYQWAYEGNETNVTNYGRLYTFYAATDGRNICPEGWHVPSDEEWKTLELELGMNQADLDILGFRGTDQGSMLAGNIGLWADGILETNPAFNTSGFGARPGGYRHGDGSFHDLTLAGDWWSSSSYMVNNAWRRGIIYSNTNIDRNKNSVAHGFSIRCMKD